MTKLTKKQLKFCREYLKTSNAYQSAIKAGYSKAYAKNASKQILENRGIQNYIRGRTEKVEKQEDSTVDEVLKNIFKIASGKPIKRDFVQIDNMKKEITLKGVPKDFEVEPEMRAEYEDNETTITSAPIKEQVAAAELWLKFKGQLKNDSDDVEKQKIRKLKADADIAEWKAGELAGTNKANDKTVLVDDIGGNDNGNNGN